MYINNLIDTHCDTAHELYKRGEALGKSTCHISIEKARKFKKYAQFFAIWSDKRRSDDEAFSDFIQIRDNFRREINEHSNDISFVTSFSEMERAFSQNKIAAFLAVEDARLLGGKLDRLNVLYNSGVKYLTLTWGGSTCIGGSHNVEGGLTEFGREVVCECFRIGIIPDISHANYTTSAEVIDIAYKFGKPVIASHSNSYSLYPHTRNLADEHAMAIVQLGGIIGVSLCPSHLTDTKKIACDVKNVVDHILNYVSIGAENNIGLGCDLDGTDLPYGFSSISDLTLIADELQKRNASDSLINKIFYENYYNFIKNNLK